jgi:hypothetical protein
MWKEKSLSARTGLRLFSGRFEIAFHPPDQHVSHSTAFFFDEFEMGALKEELGLRDCGRCIAST